MRQESLSVYEHIRKNNRKTILLIFLFPMVFVFWTNLFLFLFFFFNENWWSGDMVFPLRFVILSSIAIFGIISLWSLISYLLGPKIVMPFTGAQKIEQSQNEYKALYNIVENTAIMAGLPMPKLYLLDDDSLNAFTAGTTLKNAIIVVSRGLIENLTLREESKLSIALISPIHPT